MSETENTTVRRRPAMGAGPLVLLIVLTLANLLTVVPLWDTRTEVTPDGGGLADLATVPLPLAGLRWYLAR